MTDSDPSHREDANGRLAVDPMAATDLSTRLAKAETRLQTVHSELLELLADADTAIGVGVAASAFRQGFGPATQVTDLLSDLTTRLGAYREVVTRGVDAVADADHDAAAVLGDEAAGPQAGTSR